MITNIKVESDGTIKTSNIKKTNVFFLEKVSYLVVMLFSVRRIYLSVLSLGTLITVIIHFLT